MDQYKKFIKSDIGLMKEYLVKSVLKTEQQKMLEQLLSRDDKFSKSLEIADICAGGGDIELSLSRYQ